MAPGVDRDAERAAARPRRRRLGGAEHRPPGRRRARRRGHRHRARDAVRQEPAARARLAARAVPAGGEGRDVELGRIATVGCSTRLAAQGARRASVAQATKATAFDAFLGARTSRRSSRRCSSSSPLRSSCGSCCRRSPRRRRARTRPAVRSTTATTRAPARRRGAHPRGGRRRGGRARGHLRRARRPRSTIAATALEARGGRRSSDRQPYARARVGRAASEADARSSTPTLDAARRGRPDRACRSRRSRARAGVGKSDDLPALRDQGRPRRRRRSASLNEVLRTEVPRRHGARRLVVTGDAAGGRSTRRQPERSAVPPRPGAREVEPADVLRRSTTQVIEPRRDLFRVVLRRGIERGELRADTDVELVVTLILGRACT